MFLDKNNNGVRNGGEVGVDGLTVNLWLNGNPIDSTGSVDGDFELTDLWPGNYAWHVAGGYTISTPLNGSGMTAAPMGPGGAARRSGWWGSGTWKAGRGPSAVSCGKTTTRTG